MLLTLFGLAGSLVVAAALTYPAWLLVGLVSIEPVHRVMHRIAMLIALSIVHGFKSVINEKVLGFAPHITLRPATPDPLFRADTLETYILDIDGIEMAQEVDHGDVMIQSRADLSPIRLNFAFGEAIVHAAPPHEPSQGAPRVNHWPCPGCSERRPVDDTWQLLISDPPDGDNPA
jgi:hypothetical protein